MINTDYSGMENQWCKYITSYSEDIFKKKESSKYQLNQDAGSSKKMHLLEYYIRKSKNKLLTKWNS